MAFTFDRMPHLGEHDGIHYAMGYCGSGVALGTAFGLRMAQMLGRSTEVADEPLAFERTPVRGCTRSGPASRMGMPMVPAPRPVSGSVHRWHGAAASAGPHVTDQERPAEPTAPEPSSTARAPATTRADHPRASQGETPLYKGEPLDAERGPGLGCFWIQVIFLGILLVLTPLTVIWAWPPR